MLTPNKWFRAAYGSELRKYLRENARVRLIVDFGHSKTLFPDADTFPACIIMSRVTEPAPGDSPLRFVSATDEQRAQRPLRDLIVAAQLEVPHGRLLPDGWIFNDPQIEDLLNSVRSNSITLAEEIGASPLYGIKTGMNEAFYLEDDAAHWMVSDEPQSASLLRQFVRGRDVKRWRVEWARCWHIVIPSSHNQDWPWADAPTEGQAEQIFADTHPILHSHLKKYESPLRNRADQGKFWWELRSCSYYERFQRPKIVIARIAFHSSCGLDSVGYFQNDSTVLVPSTDLFVLAVLNSRLGWWYMARVFPHKKDEALSMDVDYLERFPVPKIAEAEKQSIRERCHRLLDLVARGASVAEMIELEAELSTAVWMAFRLSPREQTILDVSPVLRDPLHVLARRRLDGSPPAREGAERARRAAIHE